MKLLALLVSLILALSVLTASLPAGAAPERAGQSLPASSGGSAIHFVENVGQFAGDARFQVRGGQGALWLADDAVWITLLESTASEPALGRPDPAGHLGRPSMPEALTGVNIRLSFAGADTAPALEGFDPSSTTVSYFIGNDPEKWRPDVPVWGGVRYRELYPGLDLEVTGEGTKPVMRLVCWASDGRAALETVRLQIDGAEDMALEDGMLHIGTAAGDFYLPLLPVVDKSGRSMETGDLAPVARGSVIAAPFAEAGATQTLPTDSPHSSTLIYSAFLGGSHIDFATGMAVDAAGNATLVGDTYSIDFPTTPGAFTMSHNGGFWDAFVSRLGADGSSLIYSTYLGGDSFDHGGDVVVDAAGNATVTGNTSSTNFPTTPGAYDTSLNSSDGSGDAFVTRLNADGSDLIHSTYLGGSSNDYAFDGLALGADGSAYVANFTESPDFPTTPGAYDTSHNGLADAYVTGLSPDGSSLIYSTFLGGRDYESANAAVAAADGSVTVSGATLSPEFPTTSGAFDTSHNGDSDAFVARLNADGSDLIYGTFLGGSNGDWSNSLAVDAAGYITVVGSTQSSDFPATPGAFDGSFNGVVDVIVTRLNTDGSALFFSTFLGGADEDAGLGAVVDAAGNTIIAGHTYSLDFPITPNAFDPGFNGASDAFISRLSADGSNIQYGTYIGGGDFDGAWNLDAHSGDVATTISGHTSSFDFPTTPGAFDTTYNSPGWADAFVTRISLDEVTDVTLTGLDAAAAPALQLPALLVSVIAVLLFAALRRARRA